MKRLFLLFAAVLLLAVPASAFGLSMRTAGVEESSESFEGTGCGGAAEIALSGPSGSTVLSASGPQIGQTLVDFAEEGQQVATVVGMETVGNRVVWRARGSGTACDPEQYEATDDWSTDLYDVKLSWVGSTEVTLTVDEMRARFKAELVQKLGSPWALWRKKSLRCPQLSPSRGRCIAFGVVGDVSFTAKARLGMVVDKRPYPEAESSHLAGRGVVRVVNSHCRAVGRPNCVRNLRFGIRG